MSRIVGAPKLYNELAAWWPLLSPPFECAEEAEFYRKALIKACAEPPHTLLELRPNSHWDRISH